MTSMTHAEEAYNLLNDLLVILDSQQEQNWSQGIKAAAEGFISSKGLIVQSGFEDARSIYNSMTQGGRGFSEYYIWVEDENKRIQLNQKLDSIRLKLWSCFEL